MKDTCVKVWNKISLQWLCKDYGLEVMSGYWAETLIEIIEKKTKQGFADKEGQNCLSFRFCYNSSCVDWGNLRALKLFSSTS